ncbi:MAG: hypothetical protein KAS32_26660 [Candidatus Peribacteraceae bacterium]|nr:hypothetical protein [Candidatus Peribacteraceae bacterium]
MSDKKLFYRGLMIGLLGGVLGNLWASSIYDWAFNVGDIPKTVLVVVMTIIFGLLLFEIERKM